MQSNIIVNICSLFYKKNVFMVELREFYFMLLHLVAEYFMNMSLFLKLHLPWNFIFFQF